MEPIRVLYVEDDLADQELTRRHLERQAPDLKLIVVSTVTEALVQLADGNVDVVLADYRLPDGTGLDLLQAMKAKELPAPVILVTGAGDAQSAVRLLKAGAADYVVKRPGYLDTLPSVLEGALQWFRSASERRRTAVRALYAEDDLADVERTRRALREELPHLHLEVIPGGREALERLRGTPYDLFLLDHRLPDLSGIEVLKALREERIRVPVVMVTGQEDEDMALQAFKLGVADYVIKREGYLTKLPSVLEHVLIRHRLAEETQAIRALAELGRLISQSLDPQDVHRRIVESICTLLMTQIAVLFQLNPESGKSVAVATFGELGPMFDQALSFGPDHGLVSLAIRECKAIATPDLLNDPRITYTPEMRANLERAAFGSLVSAPLRVAGTVVGALSVGDRRGRAFTTAEIELVQSFADQAAIAVRNARLYQEAKNTRDFLQSITENSADAIVTTDIHGRITYMSPGAEDMFGLSSEEARGLQMAEFYRGGVEEGRALMDRLETEGRIRNYETIVRTKRNRRVEISSSISLLRDAHGKIVGTVAVIRDVTEQKQNEAALRHSQEQLRQVQKMEAVGRLAGGIAHDFNNLLTVIQGRTTLLLHSMGPDDPLHRHLDLIQKTAERAAGLTKQLLAFSRKQMFELKVLGLNSVITRMERILQRLIGEDVELVTTLGPALGPIKADPGQLEQVVMNLAINARDAMPRGGRLTIETANVDLGDAFSHLHPGFRPGPFVRLIVRDTGIGMDEETRARLFEPFFTTKGEGKGTGLGLSIAQTIVTQHGGYIAVDSQPGRGATFTIYLPRTEEPAEFVEDGQVLGQFSRGWETILLVEDEEGVRDLTKELLEGCGYTVFDAPHPGEALLIAEQLSGPINLLVTDVMMPHMRGPELAARLVGRRPEMKVLYISGYTDNALAISDALAAGATYLQKPFEPQVLLRKMREMLDKA